jgi:hypothetical protein
MTSRKLPILSAIFLLVALISPVSVNAAETWVFEEDAVTLSIGGKDCVDPYAEPNGSGDRIYAPCAADVPAALSVYDCTETGNCTKAALRSKLGKSFTKVKLSDGTYRAYYVAQDFNTCTNTVETGLLSTDGLEVTGATKTSIFQKVEAITIKDLSGKEMKVCKTEAWGVPDAVVTPDGKVRIYIVEEVAGATASDASQKKCTAVDKNSLKRQDGSPIAVVPPTNEVIASYTSTDSSGTTFTKDSGYRFVGGYVDPDILRAKTGDWVAIVSTGPGCEGQQYFVATSTDGLGWKIATSALNKLNVYAGDPTGYELSANKFRIYYWTSPFHMGTGPATGFTLRRGTLELKSVAEPTPTPTTSPTPTPTPSPTPSVSATSTPAPVASKAVVVSTPKAKTVTIQCVKGKTVKKVTGVNPKCPSGYTKK